MKLGRIPSLVAAVVLATLLTGCAHSYNACKDPKSYISFTYRMCHGRMADDKEWFELDNSPDSSTVEQRPLKSTVTGSIPVQGSNS